MPTATRKLPPGVTPDDLARIRADPALFAERILGSDHWDTPRAIMRAIAEPQARVVVKACNASSKSYTAADIITWWITRGGTALVNSASWTQVEHELWPELRRAVQGSRYPLGVEVLHDEARAPLSGGMAIGISPDSAVRFQGFHGNLLMVFDEAPGIDPPIWEAAEGNSAAGDVRWLVLGNPTTRGGKFEELFAQESVRRFTIDAFQTPNFIDELDPTRRLTLADLLALPEDRVDYAVRPYLVTRRWVRDKFYEWGPADGRWESRVRGEFPQDSEVALIPMRWIYEATQRPLLADPAWYFQAGLDVAGPGEDETVLRLRQGPKLLGQWVWSTGDTLSLLTEIKLALQPWRDRLGWLVVDAVGMGYHLGGSLVAEYGSRVVLLNVAERSRYPEMYRNLKAELYWGLRERFQQGDIGGELDALTQSQLGSLRYQTPRGLVEIESKEQARKRGVKSPDRAEALMLACAPCDDLVAWPTRYVVGSGRA